MKFGAFIKTVLASAALWASADVVLAATHCRYLTEGVSGVVSLQVSAITVGRDVPIGTEVYRQSFAVDPAKAPRVRCSYSAPFIMSSTFRVGSLATKANWFQGTYAGSVYETNIDGLGVAVATRYGPLPLYSEGRMDSAPGFKCGLSGSCDFDYEAHNSGVLSYNLIFIKIGEVRPGRLVGSSLPTVIMSTKFDNVDMRGLTINMEGSIDIVSRTCSTPDVVVPMGTHLTSSFTRQGDFSDWKSFSIVLNNCPAFHGTYIKQPPGWISQGGYSGKSVPGTADKNSLAFRIDPARTAIHASNGVLSLDPSAASASPAASGIGVQIATSDGDFLPLGKNRNSGLSLRNRDSSYSIPLRARYLQTGTKVTPGPANASATFTIIYQ